MATKRVAEAKVFTIFLLIPEHHFVLYSIQEYGHKFSRTSDKNSFKPLRTYVSI
jgi:hypothetical protein